MEKMTIKLPFGIDRELVRKWMEREGITEGKQMDEALDCVITNAKGRLKLRRKSVTAIALRMEAEEIIGEEIRLTGGSI